MIYFGQQESEGRGLGVLELGGDGVEAPAPVAAPLDLREGLSPARRGPRPGRRGVGTAAERGRGVSD